MAFTKLPAFAIVAMLACATSFSLASLAATPKPQAPSSARSGGGSPPAASHPPAETRLDFSGWQKLLDDYLQIASAPGAPLETRFDYPRLYDDPNRRLRLEAIKDAMLAVAPSKLSVTKRHAWAINTYNFLVVAQATTNLVSRHVGRDYRSHGIFGIPYASVKHMQIDGLRFFEAPVAQVEGTSYTLNTFERAFVFDRYAPVPGAKPKPRPKSLDPRAHFALVCGAIGCPPLQPRAFLAESLDVQLDRACRGALESPAHLRWDPGSRRLAASAVLDWYAADFGGPAGAFEFIERYAPDSLRADLANKPVKVIDTAIAWDWNLNTVPRPVARPPMPTPRTQ